MATSNRIGGTLSVKIDGTQYEARGNFQVTGYSVKREGVAGQDGVHGFIEEPIVPQIKGDISIGNFLSIEQLEGITNSTITILLANGNLYELVQGWACGPFVIDAHDGKIDVTFQGMSMQEIPGTATA